MPALKKRKSRLRLAVQILFFVLIAVISVNHGLAETGWSIPFLSSASLHALCPLGGVVSIYQFVTSATFVKKVHQAAFILMGIGFLLAILFGPVFCGWVCPIGSLQEWIGKLGKRLFKKRFNGFLPASVDRWLRYLRYVVLAWVMYMTAATGMLVFEAYDPYFTLFNLWSSEIAVSGIAILAATLVLSLFVERPFCKYGCPYGAVQGVFNLFRIFSITRNKPTCIDCKACDKACPMNIKVSAIDGRVRNHQCITCMECTSEKACPAAETVDLGIGKMEAGK
jgi:polyferredoxin